MIRTHVIAMLASIGFTLGAAASYVYGAEPAKDAAVKLEYKDVATCTDGKVYSVPKDRAAKPDKAHVGACRGHGGVAKWADGSPIKAKGGAKAQYK